MFAVIKTGGKQYRVAADEKLRVARVEGNVGDIIQFGEVLVVGGDTPVLGLPTVSGASVAAEVLEHGRGEKVIAFKKRRRKNSRRKRGYRDEFSLVLITEILTDGAKPTKTARPKPERKPKVETPEGDEDAGETKQKAKPAKKPAAKAAKKPAAKGKAAASAKSKKK